MTYETRETDANLPLMSEVLQISQTTARLMANRGLRSKKTALAYLTPEMGRLRSPLLFAGISAAFERISVAISSNEKILVYGDFDADGITSTVILLKTLQKLGANCEYYIPHRVEEGYGLTADAVKKIANMGTKLLITVDNGISAVDEIAAANASGISTIIIDHHEPGEILPPATAIVDPKQPDCEFPFKEMCAAGIVFKFVAELCEFIGTPLTLRERDEFLMLAAIATLCDIVELTDENRIIVAAGLHVLNANKLINPGLGSLITMRGYLEKPLDAHAVGFVIGPCLNATGRLKTASLAVDLLLASADEREQRITLAQELIELNEARKNLTAQCENRAVIPEPLPKVLVLTDFEAHESIAGILAGRIRDMVNRPVILLTQGDSAAKGSGRSVPGFNIFEALYNQRHLFTRFGGHAMAAGLTLPTENIEPLRTALNRECHLTDADFIPVTYVDCELNPEEISLALSDEIAGLAPFGKGNPEPLFVSRGLFAESVRILNEKNTLIFTLGLKNGTSLKGIAFGLNDRFATEFGECAENLAMDAIYTIETNVWNGNRSVQIRIKNFSKPLRQARPAANTGDTSSCARILSKPFPVS